MNLIAVIILSFALIASGRNFLDVGDSQSRRGSPKVESPSYKVLNKTDGVEVREYDNATWAVAFGRNRWSTDLAAVNAGIELAKYFKGENSEHKSINRTVPVVGTVLRPPPPPPHHPHKNGSHPEPAPKNGSRPEPPPHHHDHHHHHPHGPPGPPGPPAVAVAGFIPKGFQGKPPKPDSPHVRVFHTNATKVFVHEFGGWAISWLVRKEIDHLAHALKDLGICAFKGKFFVASYDGPWKLSGRHNEIWWVELPKHRHHNESRDAGGKLEIPEAAGLDALDVEELFANEFPKGNEDFEDPEDSFPDGIDPEGFEWQVEEGKDFALEDTEMFTSPKIVAGDNIQYAVETA